MCGDIESCPGPSSLTREQFGSFLLNKGMKFVHQNIRSLTSNFDMLQEFVASHGKIDLITLSETHISSDETGREELFALSGYVFLKRNRDYGRGGGVSMYVKDGITFKRRSDLENSTAIKCLWIEIFLKSAKSFIVGCFYCPPETSKYHQSNFNDLLQDHLRIIEKENKETILMGDFNVNYNDTSSNTMFKTIVKLFGFKQLIKKCTRLTETSSTTIDLILSNAAQNISAVDVVATSLSDHDMVACIRMINHQRYNPRMIKC
jgi:exonuclease III